MAKRERFFAIFAQDHSLYFDTSTPSTAQSTFSKIRGKNRSFSTTTTIPAVTVPEVWSSGERALFSHVLESPQEKLVTESRKEDCADIGSSLIVQDMLCWDISILETGLDRVPKSPKVAVPGCVGSCPQNMQVWAQFLG